MYLWLLEMLLCVPFRFVVVIYYVDAYLLAVTRHPIQAENDGDMERVLILPVFKGEAGLPNTGLESINSSCKWNLIGLYIFILPF